MGILGKVTSHLIVSTGGFFESNMIGDIQRDVLDGEEFRGGDEGVVLVCEALLVGILIVGVLSKLMLI